MADYLDPKQYQEGAWEARIKAIGYFEPILQNAPQTELGEYAREGLSHLEAATRGTSASEVRKDLDGTVRILAFDQGFWRVG